MDIALLVLQMGGGVQTSIPSLIAHASLFSKAVLLLLLGLSVYSWAVIWDRFRLYSQVQKQDRAFLLAFRSAPEKADLRLTLQQHPVSVLAKAAAAGLKSIESHSTAAVGPAAAYDLAQRAMDRAANDEVAALEKNTGFLATTGSVAPFIGLMGTVWGVMASFVNIGAQGSATLVVVAPGIAEALIATAIGLFAAIPAVIAYNRYTAEIDRLANRYESFMEEFTNILQRQATH